MHRVLKAFSCSFDGVRSEMLQPGDERDFGSMADGLKRAGYISDLGASSGGGADLRDDGPTVAEYVSAGYLASNYPPRGYASRSSSEEIEAAIKAQAEAEAAKASAEELAKKEAEEAAAREAAEKEAVAAKADLAGKTNAQLIAIAKAEEIAVETDDNKPALIDKIAVGRAAKAAVQG